MIPALRPNPENRPHTPLGVAPTTLLKQPTLLMGKYKLLLKAAGFLLISASGFYFFEREAWPDLTFGDSLWWSMLTSMTVGYGDVYPKTWQGRWLVAAPTILLGIGFLAYTFGVIQSDEGLKYTWKAPVA